MIIKTKNNKQVLLRRLIDNDFDKLYDYLNHLGPDTLKRFGPHPFDRNSINAFYKNSDRHKGYIARDTDSSEIVAYSIIKHGYLEHDGCRLQSYGLYLDNRTDCTFAPSVADQWQSLGIGNRMLKFILSDLKIVEAKRIILWGGVQCNNEKAVNFYIKNGFKTLGQFEHHGWNYDMILEIV
jgi:diamine N-acetyltransferase